jgi:hypothetical protein
MAKDKVQTKALVKAPPPGLPVIEEDWEKQLGADAQAAKAAFTSGVPRITVDAMKFVVDGTKTGKDEIVVAVIDWAWAKEFYDQPYQQGVAGTPACYAFGHGEKGLFAHVGARDQQNVQEGGQSPCDGCKHNAFGTAFRGRGKRCADKPRLMVVLPHDMDGDTKKVGTYQLSVPPSSLSGFSRYLGSLKDFTKYGDVKEALHRVKIEPLSGKAGYELVFSFEALVSREKMPQIVKWKEGAFERLTQPFPDLSEQAPEVPAAPIKGQGKPAGKGKR